MSERLNLGKKTSAFLVPTDIFPFSTICGIIKRDTMGNMIEMIPFHAGGEKE